MISEQLASEGLYTWNKKVLNSKKVKATASDQKKCCPEM